MNKTHQSEEEFRGISPAEFFYRNRQMAGFGNPTQSVYSTVRELVENSLDTCEDAQRLPRIQVSIQSHSSDVLTVSVADNGAGVPYAHVAEAFGRILYGSKFGYRQKRGTFGLGVTMAVLHGQITTDEPVLVHTRTAEGPGMIFRILIDVKQNIPIVENEEVLKRSGQGTTVTVNLRGDLKRARERITEYLRLTTVASPHARIALVVDDSPTQVMGGFVDSIPELPVVAKPHPRAADLELLRRLIENTRPRNLHDFLVDSFQQLGTRTATRLLRFVAMEPNTQVKTLEREDLSRLGAALRRFDGFSSPDGKSLNPIGRDAFLESIGATFNASVLKYARGASCEWEGNAFAIEGVLAFGDDFPLGDVPTLYRFANRVPLLYNASEDVLFKVLRRVNWSRYGTTGPKPFALFIHFFSTRVPYKAAGKQALAQVPQIAEEALTVYRRLGRSLSKSLKKHDRSLRETKKMKEFSEMFRLVAKYGSALAESDTVPSTTKMVKILFEANKDV
ncbi:MAG: DNA topoisomerase VI subunit B [Candidatus Thorarchaeota archaeon]